MIEINHGSHLPQHSLPPNLFSSFPKHLFIFSLQNILLKELSSVLPILYTFPINQSTSRSFHLVRMLFFSFIKKKFHLFHPLLPPNFHTNFRKNFSIRFLLIFQYTSHLSQFDSLFLSQQLLLGLIMVLFSSLSALNLYLFILFPRILSVPYNL